MPNTYLTSAAVCSWALRKDNKTLVEVMATENAWSAETSEAFSNIDAKKPGF